MDKETYLKNLEALTIQMELMNKLRCHLVAKRYERMINDLKRRYPQFSELCLQQED